MNISNSIDINCPASIVFSWVENPEKAMQWQTSVAGGEIIHDTPERIGTTFRERVEENGQSVDLQGTITNYIPDKLISFHLESRVNVVDVEFSVQEIPNGTRVRQNGKVRWKFPVNVISIFMGGKMKQGFSAQSKKEFEKLKELCESSVDG